MMENVCTWTGDDQRDIVLVDRAVETGVAVVNGRTQEAGVKNQRGCGKWRRH